MVDFPANPSNGDKHYEEGQAWTFVSPPGVWMVGEGLSGTTKIVNQDAFSNTEKAGWFVVGNKLFQWGYFSTDAQGRGTITYHKAFKTLPVVVTDAYWGDANTNTTFNTTGETTTGTEVFASDSDTGAPLTFNSNGRWIAIGEATDDLVMPTEVGGSVFSDLFLEKQTLAVQQVTGVVNFESNIGMGGDIYLNRDQPKNESGIVYTRDNDNTAAYLFWDEAADVMRLNSYNDTGTYVTTTLEMSPTTLKVGHDIYAQDRDVNPNPWWGYVIAAENGDSRMFLHQNDSTGQAAINIHKMDGTWHYNPLIMHNDTKLVEMDAQLILRDRYLQIDAPAGQNSHIHFKTSDVVRAQIYQPHNFDGALYFSMYDGAGNWQSDAYMANVDEGCRVVAASFHANNGSYYGNGSGGAANIVNDRGTNSFHADVYYHGWAITNQGGTNIGWQAANAVNTVLGTCFADWWSDGRLKANVRETDVNACDMLRQIGVVQFDWNDLGQQFGGEVDLPPVEAGFMADNVKAVFPDMVAAMPTISPDNDKSGDYDNLFDMVNTKKMIPYLVKAVQELTEEVERLKNDASGTT